jgi:hypothetical protein
VILIHTPNRHKDKNPSFSAKRSPVDDKRLRSFMNLFARPSFVVRQCDLRQMLSRGRQGQRCCNVAFPHIYWAMTQNNLESE